MLKVCHSFINTGVVVIEGTFEVIVYKGLLEVSIRQVEYLEYV